MDSEVKKTYSGEELKLKFVETLGEARAQQVMALLELHHETDRGAALVAASYLDVLLANILSAYFVGGISHSKLFMDQGPLATFSAKIAICRSLGLITEEEWEAVTLVRMVRNVFAHHLSVNFSHPKILKELSKRPRVYGAIREPDEAPRSAFLKLILYLTFDLRLREDDIRGAKTPPVVFRSATSHVTK